MAEWQTRKLEVFVERSVLVQVQLSAPKKCETIGLIFFVQITGVRVLRTNVFSNIVLEHVFVACRCEHLRSEIYSHSLA